MLRNVFLVDVFLRDAFEVPLARSSFSSHLFGTCLGCLLDAVRECSKDAFVMFFLVFRPQM